jgi:hypothetical protein
MDFPSAYIVAGYFLIIIIYTLLLSPCYSLPVILSSSYTSLLLYAVYIAYCLWFLES